MNQKFFQSAFFTKNLRGQLTIFIIIAIIIVAIVSLFFILRGNLQIKNGNADINADRVYTFVDNCIDKTINQAILEIGQRGGYFSVPEKSIGGEIPYYIYNNKKYIPSKEKIENEIQDYTKEQLNECTNNFQDFADIEIREDDLEVKVNIKETEIIFEINYPITIIKEESKTNLKDFDNKIIPVKFGVMYEVANEIIESQMNKKDICLSCISSITEEKDVYLNLIDYNDNATIFIMNDEQSLLNNEPVRFIFAIER